MPCFKCVEHRWPDPQPPLRKGLDYCLFHAPADKKGISVDEFNERVFARIEAFKDKNKPDDMGELCNLSGTIFPDEIVFMLCGKGKPLPGVSFSKATFSGVADFQGTSFSDVANFQGATFSDVAEFEGITFNGETVFQEASFGGGAYFQRAEFVGGASFVGAEFHDVAEFRWARFSDVADFQGAKFNGQAQFGVVTYSGLTSFLWATFSSEANFQGAKFDNKTTFQGATFSAHSNFELTKFTSEAKFLGVKAEENALFLHSLSIASLSSLLFTSMETEYFSFKGCDWPDGGLWLEINAFSYDNWPNYKTCEELYRSLKQKAAGEHDQPMVSKWHYREKLMDMRQKWYRRFVPITPTWLYWASSGFGERSTRAWWLLVGLCLVPFVLFGYDRILETARSSSPDWSIIATVFDEWSLCIPFVQTGFKGTAKYAEIEPWKLRISWVFQILIALQASLFAFALRNRFRR